MKGLRGNGEFGHIRVFFNVLKGGILDTISFVCYLLVRVSGGVDTPLDAPPSDHLLKPPCTAPPETPNVYPHLDCYIATPDRPLDTPQTCSRTLRPEFQSRLSRYAYNLGWKYQWESLIYQ